MLRKFICYGAGTTYTILNYQFIGLGNYDFVIIKK